MQLQLSAAASLRANWLGIITVDVLPMADSEDKLGGPLHYYKPGLNWCCRIVDLRERPPQRLRVSIVRRSHVLKSTSIVRPIKIDGSAGRAAVSKRFVGR